MEQIESAASAISGFLWGVPMITLLIGTHIFLTIRLHFPQRYIFKAIKLSVTPDKNTSGDISPFGSVVTSLAATLGTGNIIGVATAVALGGPGAVFWCWLTGVLGIATKYGEGLLAVKYRVMNVHGQMIGGPMYALERGLKMKWLGVLFCIFTAMAAFGIGNSIQANSIAQICSHTLGASPYWVGGTLSILTAMVILFGIKTIAKVCSAFVPFMAIFYILGCTVILIMNSEVLWQSIVLIAKSAFSTKAVGGGFVGTTIIMTMRYGIARGLFSNESGMGSAPIISAAAQTRNPVRQALVTSTGTFWDTVVVCAITGLVIVSSIVAYHDIDYTQGAVLTYAAFDKIPYVGQYVLMISLITFSFSTILGWPYYGEKAVEYLGGDKLIIYYRIMWVIAVFMGSVLNLELVWNIADSMNALMAIPNLISLLLLSGVLVSESRKYLWDNNIDGYDKTPIPKVKDI
ncbi:MAG: sodium:alanine symporter family protein [Bacteroidales bacterium]